MKPLFISTKAYPGTSSVGRHGAGAKLWKFSYLEDLFETAGSSLTPTVDADFVIFGAYHPSYEKLNVTGKKGFFWTSCLFEMEQSGGLEFDQLTRVLQLLGEKKIDFVFFGDEALAEISDHKKTFHVPYPVDTSIKAKKVEKIDGIGLFMPAKFSKNLATQLGAVRLLQKEEPLKLYTNVAPYEPLLKWLKIDYELKGWLPREEYWDLLSKMKVNLSCTISETFSYQVLEAALLGTTSVVSKAVKSMDLPQVTVSNPNSPLEIKEKIMGVLGKFPPEVIRKWAIETTKENNEEAKRIMERLK